MAEPRNHQYRETGGGGSGGMYSHTILFGGGAMPPQNLVS